MRNRKRELLKRFPTKISFATVVPFIILIKMPNSFKKVDFENLDLGNQDYFSYFISDQLIEVDKHKCIVFLYEYENSIVFYDIDNGKAIRTFELNGRSEFIPIIEDINIDGRMNLLFADDSNQLTCIDLGRGINILNK